MKTILKSTVILLAPLFVLTGLWSCGPDDSDQSAQILSDQEIKMVSQNYDFVPTGEVTTVTKEGECTKVSSVEGVFTPKTSSERAMIGGIAGGVTCTGTCDQSGTGSCEVHGCSPNGLSCSVLVCSGSACVGGSCSKTISGRFMVAF